MGLIFRQQGRVYVDQPVVISLDESLGENTHESCKYDQVRINRIDDVHQGIIEHLPVRVVFVVDHMGGDVFGRRTVESPGAGLITTECAQPPVAVGPVLVPA